MPLAFIAIALASLIVSAINIKYGLFIALVELFIGSQGHLFFYTIGDFNVSIRIAIFASVMLVWLLKLFNKTHAKKALHIIKQNKELVWLALICVWGVAFALIRNNSLANVFLDFNAWLYFLYFLPFLGFLNKKDDLNTVLQLFTASTVAIIVKTFTFLYVFSHQIPIIKTMYSWGRDTRWGEFTLITDGIFRIFSQAHIFVLIGFFIALGYLSFKKSSEYKDKHNKWLNLYIVLTSSIIIVSLSRSFWVGLAFAFLVFAFVALFNYKFRLKKSLLLLGRLLLTTVIGFALLYSIINIPIGQYGTTGSTGSMIKERLTLSGAAASSRWAQVPGLTAGIIKHPVIGSGWGTTITYQSQDPRILTPKNPQGWYTTYAFEWGYLDFALKIGLLGVIIYIIFLISILKRYIQLWRKKTDRFVNALIIGLMLGLVALIIVHGFTPYLNHPLGIGYLLLLLLIHSLLQDKIAPTKA